MLDFPRWKIIGILLCCVAAIYFALPNFLKDEHNQPFAWLPDKTINLGLDLQGGAHLLLEVDFDTYLKEQTDKLRNDIRDALRSGEGENKRIGYSGGLQLAENGISFTLREPELGNEVRKIILKSRSDVTVDYNNSGLITVTFSTTRLKEMQQHVLAQSIEIVRRRVDETGTREPIIQRQGDNRILLQVPGLADPKDIKRLLGTTAKLTFHLLDENAPFADSFTGVVGNDVRKVQGEPDKDGNVYSYLVKKKIELSGESLVDASASYQNGQPVVAFRFDTNGAKKFGQITKENVGRPFAVILDNKVITAPRINEPILGGSGIISGNFTVQSANDLALLLRAGALPAPLKIVEERSVGPSLGLDSIEAGKKASLVGIILVMVVMFVSYGRFGVYSNIGLIMNMVLVIATLSLFGATLTMPGIAGIVLTMGMAVDANVLIFERVREELRNGRPVFSAMDAGFRQAFITILDSNLTTLLAALLLYIFGSGPIKGFAVTLAIGIITSMFTAILLTRMLIALWLKRTRPKTIRI